MALESAARKITANASDELLPDLYLFLDYRKYLLAYYEYRKQQNAQFSYRLFAKEAGMNSLNYLKMIISGQRNLSRKHAKSLCKVCDFGHAESQYFLALVEWNQSRNDKERLKNWNLLVELTPQSRGVNQLSHAQLKVLSNWKAIVIMEMFRLKDMVYDAQWVKQRFRGEIEEAEVLGIFKELNQSGLVQLNAAGRPQVISQEIIKLSGDVKSAIVEIFHRQMSQEAVQAYQEVPAEKKEFNSITLPIRSRDLPRFKEEFRRFIQKLLQISGNSQESDDVYQFTLQLFPLTRSLKDPDPSNGDD